MSGIFISGTGTNIGKTTFATALIKYLRAQDVNVAAIKPVMSGFADNDKGSDAALLLKALGKPATPEHIAAISPWRYAEAISPHMAMRHAGEEVSLQEVVEFCTSQLRPENVLLCEGAGGIFSPLNYTHTHVDLALALKWPVVLVGGAYLGGITHILSAAEAARARGVHILALVLNANADAVMPLDVMVQDVRNYTANAWPVLAATELEELCALIRKTSSKS